MSDTPQDPDDDNDDRSSRNTDDLDISPSVRRLLRQYDIDARSIRGTGPNGRIRPNDVLAIVGNPALVQHAENAADTTERDRSMRSVPAGADRSTDVRRSHVVARGAAIGTTLFACNLSRVLAARSRAGPGAPSVACYVAHAALEALGRSALGTQVAALAQLIVTGIDSTAETLLTPENAGSPAAVHDALERPATAAGAAPRLRIVHRDIPGHLVELMPPIEGGELAALSVGGLQRGIGLGLIDGADTPRVVVQCQLALSYRTDAIEAAEAARFVGECVRMIESWPLPEGP